jgi:hypothetical protein
MAKTQVAEKSSGMVYVYSTLATPQKFTRYNMPDPTDINQMGRLPVVEFDVLIKGGAGIASKNLITRQGVMTRITQEEYAGICELESFKKFVADGFITVEKKDYDIDKIIGDMNPRDPGGPITPADYETAPKDGTVPLPTDQDKIGTGWVANQLSNR